MRGNSWTSYRLPTQRDERLGWTGDRKSSPPTASFIYDVSGFLQSWLVDLVIEQGKADGIVPQVIQWCWIGQ